MRQLAYALSLSILAFTFSGCSLLHGPSFTEATGYQKSEPTVRVLIIENAEAISMETFDPFALDVLASESRFLPEFESGLMIEITENDEVLLTLRDQAVSGGLRDETSLLTDFDSITLFPEKSTNQLEIADVPYGVGWWWEGKESRLYEGTIEVVLNDANRLNVIVELPVEEYLRGVVPSEIGPSAPEEALKAQAVAARSETITALRERVYEGPGYDICADVNCQVYAGVGRRNENTDDAIKATRGLIIAQEGESIPAYYASNCGGHSEDIQNVWPDRDRGTTTWDGVFEGPITDPGDLSNDVVLKAWVDDMPQVYCNRQAYPGLPEWVQKNFRWERESTAAEVSEYLKAKGHDIGLVQEIETLDRGVSGRLNNVRFVGTKGDVTIGPELAIRRTWESPLKSSAFTIESNGDGEDKLFTIKGAGYGHGVGMCQTGAMARALEGQTFDQILTHYYTGVDVRKMYE